MKYLIRIGLSTNSSSSHSILISRNPDKVKEDFYPWDFGWEFFVCKTPLAKMCYLIANAASDIYIDAYQKNHRELDRVVVKFVDLMFEREPIKRLFIDALREMLNYFSDNLNDDMDVAEMRRLLLARYDESYTVIERLARCDHESRWNWRYILKNTELSQFMLDFIEWVVFDPKVIIVGGNDNFYDEENDMSFVDYQYQLAWADESEEYDVLWRLLRQFLHYVGTVKMWCMNEDYQIKKEGDKKYTILMEDSGKLCYLYVDFGM